MKKMLVALTLVATSSSVFAAGYGTAGCGLGSMLIGDKPGMIQLSAVTTNGTSGSQTFGITSGTSNCGSGGKSTEAFIEANKVALSNDVARGQGETLNTLAEMMGVKNADAFAKKLQSQYNEIFKSAQAKDISAQINNIAKTNNLL